MFAQPDEGTSNLIVLVPDRIWAALLSRDVQIYEGITIEAIIGWLYCLSNFVSSTSFLSILFYAFLC